MACQLLDAERDLRLAVDKYDSDPNIKGSQANCDAVENQVDPAPQ